MILSDRDIRTYIEKCNLIESSRSDVLDQIGPASFDFRLWTTFKVYKKDQLTFIDPQEKLDQDHLRLFEINEGDPFIIHPHQFVLGITEEKVNIPRDLMARCDGRSSLGRLGLIIHSTSGLINPGHSGCITLEMTNVNEVPIMIYPGMRIGQFIFEKLTSSVEVDYAEKWGKYQNQVIAWESQIEKDNQ